MSFFQGHKEFHKGEDISRRESSIQHESQNAAIGIKWLFGAIILLGAIAMGAIQDKDLARREFLIQQREAQQQFQQPNYQYKPWGNQ